MFECECCGECCSGTMKVFLNPDDLVRMTEALGYGSTAMLFENGFVVIDTERDGAPLPRLKFRTLPVRCCPFLDNDMDEFGLLRGFCRLHPHMKPLVCSLAPYYRTYDLETGRSEWGFMPPFTSCPGCRGREPQLLESRPEEAGSQPVSGLLESEEVFFSRLSVMLESGSSYGEIVNSLYYLDTADSGLKKGRPVL